LPGTIKVKQFRILLVFLILSSFLIINIHNAEIASGEYAIKVGQSVKFKVNKLQDEDGSIPLYIIGGVYLQEGCIMDIIFTTVEPTYYRYTLITNLGNQEADELSYFMYILVLNREWNQIRAEWEPLGYTIQEDDKTWSATLNETGGYLEASYNKEDGILIRFYAINVTEIVDLANLYEVEFIRIGYVNNNYWMISFVYIIPLLGTIIGYSLKAAGKGKMV